MIPKDDPSHQIWSGIIFLTKFYPTVHIYYGENVYYGKEVKKVGHHEILFGLHCAQNDPKG